MKNNFVCCYFAFALTIIIIKLCTVKFSNRWKHLVEPNGFLLQHDRSPNDMGPQQRKRNWKKANGVPLKFRSTWHWIESSCFGNFDCYFHITQFAVQFVTKYSSWYTNFACVFHKISLMNLRRNWVWRGFSIEFQGRSWFANMHIEGGKKVHV